MTSGFSHFVKSDRAPPFGGYYSTLYYDHIIFIYFSTSTKQLPSLGCCGQCCDTHGAQVSPDTLTPAPLAAYPGEGLADHMLILAFDILRSCHTFPDNDCASLHLC